MKGFSLVELLVAMAVTLVVAGATLSLIGPAHDAFQVQPETADLQQRARVGIDALQRELLIAGAGMYAAGDVGALHQWFAPIMPYRAFAAGAVPLNGTPFTSDAISLLYVPSSASQTTLAEAFTAGTLDLRVEQAPTCPASTVNQVCGFASGDQMLVFEPAGNWAVFAIDGVDGGSGLLLKGPPHQRGFAMGANVAEVRAVTYALRRDPAAGTHQLVRAEGASGAALPLLDHVVMLRFQYFGVADPPLVIDGTPTPPRVSYGPSPPPADAPLPGWPAGENCTFALLDGRYQTRLAVLGAAGSIVELAPELLTDGPWCPDADAPNRFDADLLRVRRVRAVLRLQTPLASLRGPASALFSNGGLARNAGRYVPDLEVPIDVTPRNLSLEP